MENLLVYLKSRNQSKKAWMRIVEAFIAVILIMTVMLVVVERQRLGSNSLEEIQIKQKNILSLVSRDDVLRNELLSWRATLTNEKIKYLVPAGYNYSIELCKYDQICPLNFTVPADVFSDETLIVANLTQYDPDNAVKLKLFFWKGPFPAGQQPHDYDEPLYVPEEEVVLCGNGVCDSGETYHECPSDNCPQIAILDTSFSQKDSWIYSGRKYVNWTIYIGETNGFDWTMEGYTECWKNKPSDVVGWNSNCNNVYAPAGVSSSANHPYAKNVTSNILSTEASGNYFNRTYFGHDTKGNSVNTSTFVTISFS
jgi:hypothetical protein